jgi:hypothetical protein
MDIIGQQQVKSGVESADAQDDIPGPKRAPAPGGQDIVVIIGFVPGNVDADHWGIVQEVERAAHECDKSDYENRSRTGLPVEHTSFLMDGVVKL